MADNDENMVVSEEALAATDSVALGATESTNNMIIDESNIENENEGTPAESTSSPNDDASSKNLDVDLDALVKKDGASNSGKGDGKKGTHYKGDGKKGKGKGPFQTDSVMHGQAIGPPPGAPVSPSHMKGAYPPPNGHYKGYPPPGPPGHMPPPGHPHMHPPPGHKGYLMVIN